MESWEENSKLGDVIMKVVNYFMLYPVYVSEFEIQMKTLRETKKSNPKFAEFLNEAFVKMEDKSNDLGSLLVTPVQRIPRYLMLVKELLKYTWQEHVSFSPPFFFAAFFSLFFLVVG